MFRILDTETASLSGGVVEIAWIDVDKDLNVLQTFRSFVNPERPIDSGASTVHGIFDCDVQDARPLHEFKADWGTDPAKVIGHNVKFDLRMLNKTFPVEGSLCTLALARQLVRDSENHKLQTLRAHFGIAENVAHSAAGDTATTLEVLKRLVILSNVTVTTLWERSQLPKMVQKMPFGKHKGMAISKMPSAYRTWLLNQSDLDKDLRYTLEKLSTL